MRQANLKSSAQALIRLVFSLRARLIFLVLLIIVPAFALVIHIAEEERQQGLDRASEKTLKLAREVLTNQYHTISSTRDFLGLLAQYPELNYPKTKACPALLAKNLKEHPEYANLFVLALDGDVVCSAQPFAGRVNASDRAYFQLAVARKSFSVGEYQIGRITGKTTLAFGYPVLNATGKFHAVLAASQELTHLSDLIKAARLPEGSTILLIDSKGTVLVRHPDPERIVGESMADKPLIRRLLAAKREEVSQEAGLDGVHRLYAFAPVKVGDDPSAYLGIGIPIKVALADADRMLENNLTLLGLVTLLGLTAACLVSEFSILRPVNNLVNETERLALGDLSARTGPPYERSELGQLACAFDHMADSLQRRQAEIEQAQRSIHYSDQRMRMMVEAVQDYAIIMLDPDGYVVTWNSGAECIHGYHANEIVGKHLSCFYTPEDIEHRKPEHGLKMASSEGRSEDEGWRLRKDGSSFWASVVITPVRDDKGQIIAYSKITHDLTEHTQAEELIHAHHQELQTLYQIGQAVLTSPDLNTALEKILDEAVAVDSFDQGMILLLDPSGEKIEAAASRGYRDPANIKTRAAEGVPLKTLYRALSYRNTSIVENVPEAEGLPNLKREGVQSTTLTPIRAGEKTLGVLQLGSRTRRQFDADKVRLLEAIGSQVGIAAQKSSLYEEIKRNLERIRALHEINLATTSTLDLRGILNRLLEKIDLFIPYSSVTTVRLLNKENGQWEAVACRNVDEDQWKSQTTITPDGRAAHVLQTKKPVAVQNVQTAPFTYNTSLFSKYGLVSYLGVPLIVKDVAVGILNVYTKEEREFSDDDVQFLMTLAGQAAVAIEHARMFDGIARAKNELESTNRQLEQSLRRLGSLYMVMTPIDSAASIPELMDKIIERLMEATGADAAIIRDWNKEDGTFPIVAHRGFSHEHLRRVDEVPPGKGLDWVIKHNKSIITPDIASEPRLKSKVQLQAGLRSCAMIPLTVHGEVHGILHVANRQVGHFHEGLKDHLNAIARQMSIVLENRELFLSLKSSRDELEKSNQIKDQFLGIVSHELRTPLNVIMGYSGLLAEGMFGELSPDQNNATQTVMSQSKDLLSLVNHLLLATQVGSGNIPVRKTTVNLTGFLDELKMAYDLPTEKKLPINWDYPLDLPFVETDSGKLREILQNLLSNAIKFTEEGTVSIAARHRPEAKTVVFKVADTGIGIAEESLPNIFEKFHQVDSSDIRLYGGVGLGLYIVKKYTELIGGEVEVQSDLGKGSTFTVTIPCETARHAMLQDSRFEQTL